jgi:K+-sensing histidine kinase KdpD
MKKPENDNIGLGLAASKSISVEMGGDIRLKLSRKNLTVFQFKIPVKIEKTRNNSHLAIYTNDNEKIWSENI